MPLLRKLRVEDIKKLPEHIYRVKFMEYISKLSNTKKEYLLTKYPSTTDIEMIVNSGLLTFFLHTEARIASSLGLGFYTIGPCGEELLGAVGLHLKSNDSSALHYRHVGTAICRSLKSGRSIDEIALDRARGIVPK